MDGFEQALERLRRGQAADTGPGLPIWTAGHETSRALREVIDFGRVRISGAHLDATYVWLLIEGVLWRISRADGSRRRQPLDGTLDLLRGFAFTSDVLVTLEEEQLRVWEPASGRLRAATDVDDIPLRAGDLTSLAVGHGVAVTGTRGGYLLMWDLSDGKLLVRTPVHGGAVTVVAITDDDGPPTVFSVGGEDANNQTVCFRHLSGLRRIAEAPLDEDTGSGGWTGLDGHRRAVTVSHFGTVTVWDPQTAAALAEFPTPDGPMGPPAFIAGGTCAVIGADALRIVDLRDGTIRGTIRPHRLGQADTVVACDGLILAAPGWASLSPANLMEITDPLPQDTPEATSFRDATLVTVDGRPLVAALDRSGPIRLFDPGDGSPAGDGLPGCEPAGEPTRLTTVAVDGRDLLVVMSRLAPTTVDPSTGETRTTGEPPLGGGLLSDVATGFGLIAVADRTGVVAVWDADSLALRASAALSAASLALIERDGRPVLLTAGDDGGMIRWFDAVTLTELTPPARIVGEKVRMLGGAVVTVVGDTVMSADPTTGEACGPSLPHPHPVQQIWPSLLDGVPVVATICREGQVRLWAIATGRQIWEAHVPPQVGRIVAVERDRLTVCASYGPYFLVAVSV